MHADAPRFAVGLSEHDRFLAENERGGAAEEMRGNDGAVRRDVVRAVDDGMSIAGGIGHEPNHPTRFASRTDLPRRGG